jgi:hypothetical protein
VGDLSAPWEGGAELLGVRSACRRSVGQMETTARLHVLTISFQRGLRLTFKSWNGPGAGDTCL